MQKVKCYKCNELTEDYTIDDPDIPEKAICSKCLLEIKSAAIGRFNIKYFLEHKDDI